MGCEAIDAQSEDVIQKDEYVVNYSDQLLVKVFGALKSNLISHHDIGTQTDIEYKPNENFNLGFGVAHKWLAFDLGIKFGFVNNDNETFGDTKRFDIQSTIYLSRFVFDIHYQRYKGYYASKPWLYLEGYSQADQRFPIRPDLKTSNTAINALYVFRPDRFSYKAAFIFNQRQLKSGGSWLLTSYLSTYVMDADSIIVPETPLKDFDRQVDFRKTRFTSFGLGGGYGHTFIIGENTFFSITASVGFGPSIRNFSDEITYSEPENVKLAVRGGSRLSFGHNSEKRFYGLSVIISNSTEADDTRSRLERSVSLLKIFYGKRFTTPKIVKKIM